MNPLDRFEYEQRLLGELQELFEFVPPTALRRTIEDLFFHLLTAEEEVSVSKRMSQHIYLLINFLNEAERLKK